MNSTAPCIDETVTGTPLDGHPAWYRGLVGELRQRRKELGLSQPDVAARIGVSDYMVAKWENGQRNPSPQSVWWWCEALGCEVQLRAVRNARHSWR